MKAKYLIIGFWVVAISGLMYWNLGQTVVIDYQIKTSDNSMVMTLDAYEPQLLCPITIDDNYDGSSLEDHLALVNQAGEESGHGLIAGIHTWNGMGILYEINNTETDETIENRVVQYCLEGGSDRQARKYDL